jgi:DNA-binding transcriptional LysR family regulator
MNLLHLQYFYTVAQEGGFTKASQALGIRQPAISRMVKQFEESLGFRLLERRNQGVHLTTRGRHVFTHAKKIFGEVQQLKNSLGDIKGECFGDLIFGASEPLASYLVPEVLRSYSAKYPKVYPQFLSGPASYLLRNIQKGKLEFGVFFHLPDLPTNLAIVEKISVPFHLVVSADAKAKKNILESFIGSREIDDTSTKKFPTLHKWKQIEPKASIRFSTNNLTAHKSMVAAGLGISVLPHFLVDHELKSKKFVDLLPAEKLKFDLKVVFRETATPSANAKMFLHGLGDSLSRY